MKSDMAGKRGLIKPDFYDRFTCMAGRCPLTCCQEWKISVDDTAYERWRRTILPDQKTLGDSTTMRDGQRIIALEKDGTCPFLDGEKLCKLVLAYGDEMLSETCAVFPRELHEYEDRIEYALTELESAVAEAGGERLFTIEERNELFLDLAVNYRKEGLYQSYLELAAGLAEALESVYGEAGDRGEQEALLQRYERYERDMRQYGTLFRNVLTGELYAECLLPGYSLRDMVIKLQWTAMEYAVVRQVLFLLWQEKEHISYEVIRDEMVVVFRMTGYDDDDIVEYLENSFKNLIWDWGYLALVVGTGAGADGERGEKKHAGM